MIIKNGFYNVLFLPAIIVIGLLTSYEDIVVSKIRNCWVVLGFLFIGFVYGGAYIVSWHTHTTISFLHGFDKFVINIIVSLVISYTFWKVKLWGAGDAKLFCLFAAMIPIQQYSMVYFDSYFISFLLLLFTFLPAMLFILFRCAHYFLKTLGVKGFLKHCVLFFSRERKNFDFQEFFKILLGLVMIFLFFQILQMIPNTRFLTHVVHGNTLAVLLILVSRPLFAFLQKKIQITVGSLMVLLASLAITTSLDWRLVVSDIFLAFVRGTLVLLASIAVKRVVELYVHKTFNDTIRFAPFMFLGALLVWFF
ncbi:MAG TPA: hypothetical protein PKL77_10675 [Candidatus Omnitrophota bacterium]|nr:hypothetical protein [Candidatus Omnitrophota bacterium]